MGAGNCTEQCNVNSIGNKNCSQACFTLECAYDFGDCEEKICKTSSGKECLRSWLADGFCDSACNTEECGFDMGDC